MKLKKNFCIALFAYNRPSHLRRVLISLENYKIDKINIFLDGPKNKDDKIIQKEIKQIVQDNYFNKSINKNIYISKKNKGLAKSITSGLDILSKKYDYILVLEDDCIPRKELFKYVFKNLNRLNQDDIAGICCYQIPKIHNLFYSNKILKNLIFKYFIPWGWCIKSKDWIDYRKHKFTKNRIEDKLILKIDKLAKSFNKIWSLRFMKFNLIKNKRFIYPSKSLIKNIGFDGSGINSKVTDKFLTNYSESNSISSKITINNNLSIIQKRFLSKTVKYFFS